MIEERFMIGQPVRSLQYLLGQLSYEDGRLPFVAPDGVFGEETLEAVMVFQREFCPPVTGRVDQRTWDTIVYRFREMERRRARPRALRAFPPRPFQVEAGEQDDVLILSQTMFTVLAKLLEGIGPDQADGRHDRQSVANVLWLQHVAGQEETGVMDRFAWNALARLYDLFLVRRRELEGREIREER